MKGPIGLVLERLPSAKPSGNGQWSGRCPAHADNKASLCIGRGDDGRALIHCQAGCALADVLKGLGLTMADLYVASPARNPKAGRKIVRTYDYRNADGNLRYQVVRLEPKAFCQRRPDGEGGWVWGLNAGQYFRGQRGNEWYIVKDTTPPAAERRFFPEEHRILYRLPELLQVDVTGWIFVCEGEKDVDALVAVGLIATCNPGGALKWSKLSDDSALHGRRVCIIPDNDEPGRRHAEDVAARLHGRAREVRVLTLDGVLDGRPVKDVSDYLAAGGPADSISDVRGHLLAVVETTPVWTPEQITVVPSPLPAALGLSYRPFPVKTLPSPVATFVEVAAGAIGCDPAFVALPTLAGMAAAIGNSKCVRIKASWSEPPILWPAIVGESGSHKTPAQDAALRAVDQRQAEAFNDYQQALEQYEVDRADYKAALAAWRQGKADSAPVAPKPPICRRYVASDVTVEALVARLVDNPRGLLVRRDELAGWVNGFGQYKGQSSRAGGGGDTAAWLELHQAKPLVVDRKNSECPVLHVPRAAVCVTGGIQPETLRRALGHEHLEDGLAARLLLAMPPVRARRWSDQDVPAEAQQALEGVYNGLWGITLHVARDGRPIPTEVALDTSARDLFVGFVNEHGQRMNDLHGPIRSAYAKLEAAAARLALVFHCVREVVRDPYLANPMQVDAASMEAAITLTRWFRHEAERVYALLGETDLEAEQRQVVEVVQAKGGRITVRQLQQASRRWRSSADGAEAALAGLVQGGLGRWEQVVPSEHGGRPTAVFVLNGAGGGNATPELSKEN